ncbi:hypothetical protein HOK51_04980 [Candidatus Woesearchaeota archaeon]|jgi:hypothetical protein|nr:hypothetical protein [Candidatus Woesearchaeota archaeon]MBT6519180.1 hypothetical protein [Candidatus Woesearchaeota archaeon]MBT7368677.1 hypothetical protein [Candidatus Woesearchaeota archaeon]
MRDSTHADFLERWANIVKNSPREKWEPMLNEFINSQYQMHEDFIRKLLKTKNGKKKIINIYKIKNLKGYAILK